MADTPRELDGKFLAHFKNCTAYNRWSEVDRLAHLKALLTDDAGQVLWDSDAAATDTEADQADGPTTWSVWW